MLVTGQLTDFYPDLVDDRFESALALVHSRFSTNTFPSWPLAHPYRMIAHNGEINTVMGNENWMRAREALLSSEHVPGLERTYPICTPGASDTCRFDESLELLHLGGRSLPHSVLMMIPEAWENHESMPAEKRAFYDSTRRSWNRGTALRRSRSPTARSSARCSIATACAQSRYWVTADGLVVMASEVGVLDIDASDIVQRGRLQPGRMFLVDTSQGRIIGDEELKQELAAAHPYAGWLHAGLVHLDDLRRAISSRHSTVRSCSSSGCSATRRRRSRSSSRRWRRSGTSRSARWEPTPRSQRCQTDRACCSTTSSNSSRR